MRPAAPCDAMRKFFNSHWKVILAILLAIVLAMLTVETKSSEPPLAARLQMHTQALAAATPGTRQDAHHGALRHVETSLRRYGYAPRVRQGGDGTHPGRSIEVAVSRLAPGERPSRTFIVGAHLGHDERAGAAGIAGAAAVLELARAARALRPAYGTEIRFVFFVNDEVDDGSAAGANRRAIDGRDDGGNFMAFVGTRESSMQVRQALAALRNDPMQARQGLATPAHVMGLTLSGHGSGPNDGPALVITDAGFLRFPYFNAEAPPGQIQDSTQDRNDYDGMARIVSGLARTLGALAGAVEA